MEHAPVRLRPLTLDYSSCCTDDLVDGAARRIQPRQWRRARCLRDGTPREYWSLCRRAVCRAGGLPLDDWDAKPSQPSSLPPLGAAAPAIYACAFAFASLASSTIFAAIVTGGNPIELAGAFLPAGKAIEAGRAVDLLVAAPIQEELFFRAWLLGVLRRANVPDVAALAASAVLFAAWHLDAINGNALAQGGDGGNVLQLALLGAFLGVLYSKSGRDITLPITTHAAYNGVVLLLGAVRAL